VRNLYWRTSLGLLVVIALSVVVVVMSRRFPATRDLKTADNNPDRFYMFASGKVISCSFMYDPHEADGWMFRTAEGHLESSNQTPKIPLQPAVVAQSVSILP
jgi:hypothetical protein